MSDNADRNVIFGNYFDLSGTGKKDIDVNAGSEGNNIFGNVSKKKSLDWTVNDNVGIGKINPESNLHVKTTSGKGIRAEAYNHTDRYIEIRHGDAGSIEATNDLYIRSISPSDIHLQTNGANTRMIVKDDGKVGIGTTSPGPDDKLTVLGGDIVLRESDDDNEAVRLLAASNSGEVACYMNGQKNIALRGNDGFDSYIDAGNVGVGTTSPSTKLDVDGPIAMKTYTDGTRGSASSLNAGTMIWNSGDNAPNFSDGTNWRDAAGNIT